MNIALPLQWKNYFWDVNFDELDPHRDSWFIIERLINAGIELTSEWIIENYEQELIIDNILNNYNLSTRVISQWALIFQLDPQLCRCMSRPSQLRVFD